MVAKQQIRVLSDEIASKIAAGEVVERPSSLLKELIENSVDADATQIDIEVVSGGRKLVTVSDNGCGMDRDNALLAIERHATSKIRDVHDIETVSSMGFRGEALAAITSVSRFKLKTCADEGEGGTEIRLSGGKLVDVKDAGHPRGTTVEVRDVFFNVPARRKFLRSERTESHHLRQVLLVQALAHPAIGMSLTIDGRVLHRLAGNASLEDRVGELFGSQYLKNFRAVEVSRNDIRIEGLVSIPPENRADRNEIFLFVNNRPATCPVLGYAVNEGYRSLLPGDRYPSVFLFLSMDPSLVDVNVHPTKREVRFRRSSDVRDAVIDAIRSALSTGTAGHGGHDASVKAHRTDTAGDLGITGQLGKQAQFAIDNLPRGRTFRYPRTAGMSGTGAGERPKTSTEAESSPAHDAGTPWTWCRVLGQAGGLYVFLETEDGFVVMDPHAAHERVMFERYMAQVSGGGVDSQGLLMPETVDLSPEDALCLRKNLALMKTMGFGIAEFGGDSFVVDSLPSCFSGTSPRSLLIDISRSLEQGGPRGGHEKWREEAVAQAACKASVRARDRMSLEEIEKLVVDLVQADMPYTCPHGRPTLIFTSFGELRRRFGRM